MKKEAAFLEVLEENKARVLRICSLYAGLQEEQQDLFQEVILNLWKSFSSFRGEARYSTWVYRVCLNTCLKKLYKKKKEEEHTVHFEQLQWIDALPEKADDRLAYLRQCIKSLPEADKMMVSLFLEGLPYAEVAAIVGITENHVAVKMKRIKAKLFTCITEKI